MEPSPSPPHLSSDGDPAEPTPPTSDSEPYESALVDCAVYADGARLAGRPSAAQAYASARERPDGFVWIGLHKPTDVQMRSVAEVFGLHPLSVEDAVHAHQRPKLERYDDTLVLVLKTVRYVPHESVSLAREIVETGEVLIFVGPQFVVTVRHGDFSGLHRIRAALEGDPVRLRMGPFAVLHAIADRIVNHYVETAALVQTDIESIEEEIFAAKTRTEIGHLYFLKREVVELRRAVNPLTAALQKIVTEHRDLHGKEVRRYLRDVIDHQTVAAEQIAGFDEVLTSLVQAALARVGMQQNLDLRKISAWVAIVSVPTMIAGVYGMNFDYIPELRQEWGYPAVLLTMLSVCTVLFFMFRRNHWL